MKPTVLSGTQSEPEAWEPADSPSAQEGMARLVEKFGPLYAAGLRVPSDVLIQLRAWTRADED